MAIRFRAVRTTSVELDDERVQRRLAALRRKTGDLSPMFRDFDRDVGTFFRRQFETSGRHGGERWKPLSERTKKRRKKPLSEGGTPNIGGEDRPLWDSGNLKTSLQEVGGESIRHIGRKRYERGTRVPYAVFHQKGRGVPKREIIPEHETTGIPRKLRDAAMDRLSEHLEL